MMAALVGAMVASCYGNNSLKAVNYAAKFLNAFYFANYIPFIRLLLFGDGHLIFFIHRHRKTLL